MSIQNSNDLFEIPEQLIREFDQCVMMMKLKIQASIPPSFAFLSPPVILSLWDPHSVFLPFRELQEPKIKSISCAAEALDLFHYSLFFSLSSLLLAGVFRWSHMVSASRSGWLMGVSPQHKSGGPAEWCPWMHEDKQGEKEPVAVS